MQATLTDIQQIIALQLGRRQVDEHAHFLEDLGAESVDIMNIIITVEEKYSIAIREAEIPNLHSAAALHAFINQQIG